MLELLERFQLLGLGAIFSKLPTASSEACGDRYVELHSSLSLRIRPHSFAFWCVLEDHLRRTLSTRLPCVLGKP